MNSVEIVKSICKQHKIPISKLERDLGYGNGYIGQLRKGVFPHDRLFEIAGYLNVPMESLLSENENKPAAITGSELDIKDSINNMSREELVEFILIASARLKELD